MAVISVIVPVYKVEPYLRRCVDSILRQTFHDFELILVDDGSPDKCGEICDEYAKRDGRVVVIHQKNGGLSAARNAGIDWVFSNSKSEYIGFVDSDDWVTANYLEELHKGCKLCEIACVEALDMLDSTIDTFSEPKVDVLWDIMPTSVYWKCRYLPMTAWGKLFRCEILTNVRFPVGKIHEDEFVIPRLLFSCARVASSSSKLYRYFRRNDSIMAYGYSERNLVIIDAFVDQISMFTALGHLDLAYSKKISLCNQYYRAITKLGRKEYRPILRRQLHELNVCSAENYYLYMCAYPFKARILIPMIIVGDLILRIGVVNVCKRLFVKFIHNK